MCLCLGFTTDGNGLFGSSLSRVADGNSIVFVCYDFGTDGGNVIAPYQHMGTDTDRFCSLNPEGGGPARIVTADADGTLAVYRCIRTNRDGFLTGRFDVYTDCR